MKKIGAVIGGWRDVKLVAPLKVSLCWSDERHNTRKKVWCVQQVILVGFRRCHAWIVHHIKGTCGTEMAHQGHLVGGKGAVFDEQGGGLPATNKDNMLC